MPFTAELNERSRKTAILVAARPVFIRYGYRKTSMDDVAKSANVSRQGLYVHFARKEDLFREMIDHGLRVHLHQARTLLADENLAIGQRLIAALIEWFGDKDQLGADSDLPQASMQLAGEIIRGHFEQFRTEIGRAIEASELMSIYGARGLSAADITATLLATAQGINSMASSETFAARVTVAIAILTAPCPADPSGPLPRP